MHTGWHIASLSFGLALLTFLHTSGTVEAASRRPSQRLRRQALVLLTDFGVKDGAVCEMKGVIAGVDPELRTTDLTHQVPPFDIWQASFFLDQTLKYWPSGTVFASIIDPGVGTDRNSVVAEVVDAPSGRRYLVVTPNNGTLTLVADHFRIERLRELDPATNRLPSSSLYNTFHGRDLYAYTAARLASGQLTFEEAGPPLDLARLVKLPYARARRRGGRITGIIPSLDVNFGNVWTNIPAALLRDAGLSSGSSMDVEIVTTDGGASRSVWKGRVGLQATFGAVPQGAPLAYVNSLDCLALALNMGDFGARHGVRAGPNWTIRVTPAR